MSQTTQSQRKGAGPELCAAYAEKLSRMIACKTVWTREGENQAEFDRFYAVCEELLPNITARAKKLVFGGGCFVYVIEGRYA